ncbi:sulfite reductase subunit alpha [Luteimonas sp. 22616]|uniref:sulfite reductase subunit alpha n=1 Tax=Luteimonas sp. 22616 TaxID=3453951 RepID=UPI003F8660A8
MSTVALGAQRSSRAAIGNGLALLGLIALALAFLPLHDDAWWPASPQRMRLAWAVAAIAAYAAFSGWLLWRARRPRRTRDAVASGAQLLVAWASQTGFAQQLAERSAATLAEAGMAVELRELAEVDTAMLSSTPRVLFVVSTTGEGDPPDPALAFVRDMLTAPGALPALQFAVLALGDREYDHFCGFGHRLDQWLRQAGATPLFDLVEVDNGDAGALRHWQHHLGLLAQAPELPDWSPVAYEPWRLHERAELNPGSAGGPVFQLALTPPTGMQPAWQAGDIAEIGPRNPRAAVDALLSTLGLAAGTEVRFEDRLLALGDALSRAHLPDPAAFADANAQALADTLRPLPHREYSIASLPSEGRLQLLVRHMRRPDGRSGLGSGWLCEHASSGATIDLRIRVNANFHSPAPERPLILIGNGTGIAGLRAHLAARAAAGARRNWLLFGERNRNRDFHCRADIERWQADGLLERLDLAFSRDDAQRRYVQDALRDAADTLRAWVNDGAAIYVCGSLQGMAPGVDAVLREALGDALVEQLLLDGRYRRDVY